MPAYPLEIHRKIDRRWQQRWALRLPLNDNNPADGICPVCHVPAPVVPFATDQLLRGRIHRHWLCDACGHEWATTGRALS
jgi:hypothetical protein